MNTDGEVASTCNCLLAGVVFPFIFIMGVLKKLFLLLYFFRICWRDDMYFLADFSFKKRTT